MKQIKQEYNGGGFNISKNEIALMQMVKHRNIVRLIESFSINNYLYLVMEYCEKGDLC